MKAVIAALVATGILWVVDVEFNGGQYTGAMQRMLKSALSR
jgi:hypothetical protein